MANEIAVAGDWFPSFIDHTLLKPDVTAVELQRVCHEAIHFGFAGVCVNSSNISLVARMLNGSKVKPIAVVGFPFGASVPSAKAHEAYVSVMSGAQEIDMVINIGALKQKQYNFVFSDIYGVVASSRCVVKVILETGALTEHEKVVACAIAKAAGASFIKTCTGYGPSGATVNDVRLIREIVGDDMGIKASGGIRNRSDAEALIGAGANRIGCSDSVSLLVESKHLPV